MANGKGEPKPVSSIFTLRAHAARRPAALPNFSRCTAEGNVDIQSTRSEDSMVNARVADIAAVQLADTEACSTVVIKLPWPIAL